MANRLQEGRAFLKANPAVRDALVAYFQTTLQNEYADLIEAMGLSEPEAEKFLTIIMNASTRTVGQHLLSLPDPMPTREEFERQLKELLGASRYQQWRDLRQNMSARDLANELTRSLYYTPAPLSPSQIKELKQVVVQTLLDFCCTSARQKAVPGTRGKDAIDRTARL